MCIFRRKKNRGQPDVVNEDEQLTPLISFVIPTSDSVKGSNNKHLLHDEEGNMAVRYSGSARWEVGGYKGDDGRQKGN